MEIVAGLVISLIGLALSYAVFFRDRSKLKLKVGVVEKSKGGRELVVQVTNVGRRPAGLKYIGVTSPGASPIVSYHSVLDHCSMMDISLDESKWSKISLPINSNVKFTLLQCKSIHARDESGRNYFLSYFQLKFLKECLSKCETVEEGRDYFQKTVVPLGFSWLSNKMEQWYPEKHCVNSKCDRDI
jgi:hypothetical protein